MLDLLSMNQDLDLDKQFTTWTRMRGKGGGRRDNNPKYKPVNFIILTKDGLSKLLYFCKFRSQLSGHLILFNFISSCNSYMTIITHDW